ncbi:MAG TPA: ATP-binding protein [Vicinamibacterales bacterium]|jgi:heavy metal sensor kinase|nr:ATP-binding protein [Vicinamibacterales bacterium]
MTPWSTASVRVRLTAWYAVVLALMLVAYATATFVAVRHEFFEQFDDQLHDDFETAEAFLTSSGDDGVVWTGDRHHDPDDDEDRGSDVWLASGEQVYRSGASSSLPPVALAATTAQRRYESIVANGRPWRTLTGTSLVSGRAVVLRVSRTETHLRNQLREILVVLVLGLPVVVVLAGTGGLLLARRALTPIDHLASEARRITADRLHERLSVPNQHDEIGRLAAVINETFARLESSFGQLRRFTADASHELRTPLSVIRGIGEAGLGETRTPAEYKEAMGSMLEEVDRLTNLVDTLLRLSRGDAGTVRLAREAVDLGQLTRDAVSSLGILAEERNQRVTVDGGEGVVVTADRLVLREAITNVVDNAIKYSPRDSSIRIRVRADGHDAHLAVADEGPGIAPEDRQRIFDRFFRLDEARSREHGGAGLGLAIAKWAIEANGGRITVENGPKGGSVFHIVLPAGTPPATSDHEHAFNV